MQQSNKVALDTNMILSALKFKIDLYKEIQEILGSPKIVIPKHAIGELDKLAKENKKMEKQVNLAKELLKKNNVKEIKIEAEYTDDALEKLSEQDYIIATNDKELKKKLKGKKILIIRNQKYLELR